LERAGGGGSGEALAARRGGIVEEPLETEAGVALTAVRVEDPDLRLSAGPAEPVAGDGHRRPLADDVASEADPRATSELEAEAGRFRDGGHETGGQAGWLEGDEQRLRAASQCCEAAEPVRDAGRGRARVRPRRQVDDEEIDRPAGEQGTGDREALVEGGGSQDDEPVEPDAAGDGLDRIEAAGEVQPGDDRAIGLGLRGETEGERRLAGTRFAAKGDTRAPRQAARPEDRIEGREPGPDDLLDGAAGLRLRLRLVLGLALRRQRRGRQCSDDPRSCRTPACLEGRQSSRHVRGKRRHGVMIEQMF
jgi:hypothetical protein